jgi:hypothetical protein
MRPQPSKETVQVYGDRFITFFQFGQQRANISAAAANLYAKKPVPK